MISKAIGRHIRISPRKAREVSLLIKGKYADEALNILGNTNKKAAKLLIKILGSAIANAKRFPNMHQEDLFISCILIDGGPCLKRYKAQAMGRAAMIKRRTSHITLELDQREPRPHAGSRRKGAKSGT